MTRRSPIVALALAALVSVVAQAVAVQPGERLADPALEARARNLSAEIRCLVCQNQSIDDSDADLARDLRLIVRERIEAGDSDGEVIDYLVARYGEFVLLRPRFESHTLVLWLAGPALLVIGGVAAVIGWRRRRAVPEAASLSPEEEARLAALLDQGTAGGNAGDRPPA